MAQRVRLDEYWVGVAAENGISRETFRERVRRAGWSEEDAADRPLLGNEEYAVYRGEELLCIGTAQECADAAGVKKQTIHYYATPSGRRVSEAGAGRGLSVVRMDD